MGRCGLFLGELSFVAVEEAQPGPDSPERGAASNVASNANARDRLDGEAVFFAVTNAGYFPATLALLNSLRLTGHDQEMVLGDCGLTPDQRARLAPHGRVVEIPAGPDRDPVLLKSFAHSLEFDGVVAIIDSDMIATGDLSDVLALSAAGRICAYVDPEPGRRFAEWEEIFALSRPPRDQEYVSSGFVSWSTEHWPSLLGSWRDACERIPIGATLAHGATSAGALAQGDQDALNAVLMTEVPADALFPLPNDERPVWRNTRVEVLDPKTLRCRIDGHATKLLHADGSRKPWQQRTWWRVRNDAYVRLFRRLLFSDDVAVAASPSEVPLWLRPGRAGTACLEVLDLANAITSFAFGRRTTKYVAKHAKSLRRRLRARPAQ